MRDDSICYGFSVLLNSLKVPRTVTAEIFGLIFAHADLRQIFPVFEGVGRYACLMEI